MLETRLGDAGGREFDLWLLKIGAEVVLSTPYRPTQRGAPGAATARDVTPLG